MPHLRELVELYDGRPFAIVGINSFDDEETFREGEKEFKMNWISAYQGEKNAPISEMYRVQGYPTILLIDHNCRIYYRGHGENDELLAALVKKAEEAKGTE